MDNSVVGKLCPFPPFVSIHSVVATADGSDTTSADFLKVLLQVLEETETACRRGVAAIRERVNGDALKPLPGSQPNQRDQMPGVTVHSSIGDETHQVECRSTSFRVADSLQKDWIPVK